MALLVLVQSCFPLPLLWDSKPFSVWHYLCLNLYMNNSPLLKIIEKAYAKLYTTFKTLMVGIYVHII